jgi:hypothetical protein
VHFFTTYNKETSASIVECFNRTLKTKMWKYFTQRETLTYVDILSEMVASYNHTVHRTIGIPPAEVTWAKGYSSKIYLGGTECQRFCLLFFLFWRPILFRNCATSMLSFFLKCARTSKGSNYLFPEDNSCPRQNEINSAVLATKNDTIFRFCSSIDSENNLFVLP